MILRIGLFLAVLLAAVLLFATTRPDVILVQRSVTIAAPPDKIFPLLNDFHEWPQWASQDREDSTMARTYSGPASGAGAVSNWTSSGSAGRGRMKMADSEPPWRVLVAVDFVKPMALHNTHEILLEPTGSATTVTWTAQMRSPYTMKLMGVFVNMDNFLGRHFQSSLDNLKKVAER
jgi:uncharacterized protein YndB with AHSA1/START domain